ncbi:hypothetical protein BIU90_02580 [Curtobacterium sp. MCBA15_001]|nr:hypothetical protein BIU90_02580 [Curtobacterium sp. MCBA15_001]
MMPRRALPWSVNFLELSERGARVVRRFCRITRLDRFAYVTSDRFVQVGFEVEAAEELLRFIEASPLQGQSGLADIMRDFLEKQPPRDPAA